MSLPPGRHDRRAEARITAEAAGRNQAGHSRYSDRVRLLLTLALRNLFRHKRRTLLTASALVLGIGLMILGRACTAAMEKAVASRAASLGALPPLPLRYTWDQDASNFAANFRCWFNVCGDRLLG